MTQSRAQQRASDAVASWLAGHEKNPAWLVSMTGTDPGTIGDFLNGLRWPKVGTQGKIERALGWPAGIIRQIGNGADVPSRLLETRADQRAAAEDPAREAIMSHPHLSERGKRALLATLDVLLTDDPQPPPSDSSGVESA